MCPKRTSDLGNKDKAQLIVLACRPKHLNCAQPNKTSENKCKADSKCFGNTDQTFTLWQYALLCCISENLCQSPVVTLHRRICRFYCLSRDVHENGA